MKVKPILKLTGAQYDRLLERLVSRGEGKAPAIAGEAMQRPGFTTQGPLSQGAIPVGGAPPPPLPGMQPRPQLPGPTGMDMRIPTQVSQLEPSVVDEVMASQAPRAQVMSRLSRQREGVPFSEPAMETRDYPYAEARMKYVKDPWSEENPGGFKPVSSSTPAVKRLRTVPEGSPHDSGGGLDYSEIKYKSVETPFERKARKLAEEPRIREKGVETPSLPEIISTATMLERMWQLMGGKRGVAGHTWNQLRLSSRGKTKPVDTKEYFIRSGLRWREDPEKFSKVWPREAKILTGIWDEMSAKAGGVK